MTLIKSISGIRGTIGGTPGDALTPIDAVKFTAAYCTRLNNLYPGRKCKVVVGRDARISGTMLRNTVCGTLLACGVDVVDAGLASTPTTEMAVILEKADGGIILTASHNPRQWNALKLLNSKGEFLTAEDGAKLLEYAEKEDFTFVDVDHLGKLEEKDFTFAHIDAVLADPLVDIEAIKKAGFKAVLDAINSVGGTTMPILLEKLGVECIKLNCEPTGDFAHNPEPLPANLTGLSEAVVNSGADMGISVDPDVDRLAFFCQDGTPFGEEYTLVSVASYVLEKKAGQKYYPAAVGEVNVTTKMHEVGAVIGGEGNGGVIYPALHHGRDAYMGVALFLSNLAHKKLKMTELRDSYPQYYISKNRIEVSDPKMVDSILAKVADSFKDFNPLTIDGVKIDFEAERSWAQMRKSNTEPIIRLYCEAPTKEEAEKLASRIKELANSIINR